MKNAQLSARQYSAPGIGVRDTRQPISPPSTACSTARIRAKGSCAAAASCIRKLGFTFTAPEGFALDNTAQAVLGIKDSGSQALRVDVVRVPGRPEAGASICVSGWIEKVDPTSVEEMNINGFPAADRHRQRRAVGVPPLRACASAATSIASCSRPSTRRAETDRAFRDSVNSFRRMSVTEIEKAQPLRIKSLTVANGDTVEKIASRMATDQPLERFMVLNGLSSGQTLRPGEQVKIVTE